MDTTRILDKRSLESFIAGRKVISKVNYALARGGNVMLHIMEGGAIAAEVDDSGKLEKRTVDEIGRVIAIESVKHGGKVTLDAVKPGLPEE
jgi:hypothetical protein